MYCLGENRNGIGGEDRLNLCKIQRIGDFATVKWTFSSQILYLCLLKEL